MEQVYSKREMLDMKLHAISVLPGSNTTQILRVAGGWIYTMFNRGTINSVFVPEKYEGGGPYESNKVRV